MPLVGAEYKHPLWGTITVRKLYTRCEKTAECQARCGEWLWLSFEQLSRLKRHSNNAKLCEEGGK